MTCKVEIKFPIIKKSNFSRFNPDLTLNAQIQVLEYKRNIFEISRERFDPGMIIGNSKISIKKCQFREIVQRQPEQWNCRSGSFNSPLTPTPCRCPLKKLNMYFPPSIRLCLKFQANRMDVLSNNCPFVLS